MIRVSFEKNRKMGYSVIVTFLILMACLAFYLSILTFLWNKLRIAKPLVLNICVPWVIVLRCIDAETGKRTRPFNKTS